MLSCQSKSGFFSLRDCDQPPLNNCATCGRPTCMRHMSPASGMTNCLDCGARQQEPQQQTEEEDAVPAGASASGEYDDEWTYGYRHRYYAAGYAPIYAGHHYSNYYDDYDTRSFDSDMSDSYGEDYQEGTGFSDS